MSKLFLACFYRLSNVEHRYDPYAQAPHMPAPGQQMCLVSRTPSV